MKVPARIYFLSDNAYTHIVMMAKRGGYIPWGSAKNIGLSNFLNDLAQYDFKDTRPILIRERHEQQVSRNHSPTWASVKTRRQRLLSLTESAIQKYFELAYAHNIVRNPPYVKGNVSVLTPYPAVGYVFEGIGLQWLTPVLAPDKNAK